MMVNLIRGRGNGEVHRRKELWGLLRGKAG